MNVLNDINHELWCIFLRIDFCQKVIKRKNVSKGGKNLKIFPKPMAKRTKSTSSSKVLHKLVPRRRRNSMLFYSSWWGLIDIKISQKTPTPGIDDSLFKSIVMRIPMFIPMTRTVSEFHKEKKGYNFKLFETLHFRLFSPQYIGFQCQR